MENEDLWVAIFGQCDAITQIVLAQVCRLFDRIVDRQRMRELFWNRLLTTSTVVQICKQGYVNLFKYFTEELGWKQSGSNHIKYALMGGHLEMCKYLIGDKQLDEVTQYHSYAGSHLHILKHFYESGQLHITDDLVRETIRHDHEDCLKYVLEDVGYVSGINLCDYTVREGCTGVLRYLLDNGHTPTMTKWKIVKACVNSYDDEMLRFIVDRFFSA